MYADFAFYVTEYYGSILSEDAFNSCASRASDFIDYITFGKAKNNAELLEVKKCCCALADQYAQIQNARERASTSTGEIASESVGSHSRSFRSSAETIQGATAELTNIARRYLLPTGLLYRGGVQIVHAAHCNGL